MTKLAEKILGVGSFQTFRTLDNRLSTVMRRQWMRGISMSIVGHGILLGMCISTIVWAMTLLFLEGHNRLSIDMCVVHF